MFSKISVVLVVGLLGTMTPNSSTAPVTALTAASLPSPSVLPKLGAIRWDAWYGSGGIVQQGVETDLGPSNFQWRAPAFAQPDGQGGLSIDGSGEAQMSIEIRQAHDAGLAYWAFDLYGSDNPLGKALTTYLSNPYRGLINFSVIDNLGWGSDLSTFKGAIDSRISLFTQPTYQLVDGDRPLYYVMLPTPDVIQDNWGGNFANLAPAVAYLRQKVEAATGANPYVVVLGDATSAAAYADAIAADAISAYAPHGLDQGGSFQALSNEVQGAWNASLSTGKAVIPTAVTGWDPSPRILNPPTFGSSGPATYATATPDQIASMISTSVYWAAAHPTPANTVLAYAWNEFDEGGWIAPTYVQGNPIGDMSRLQAVGAVLNNLAGIQTGVSPNGGYFGIVPDGSRLTFDPSWKLQTVTSADGTKRTFNPDGRSVLTSATGFTLEVDGADGSKTIPDGNGGSTVYNPQGTLEKILLPDGASKVPYGDGWLHFDVNGAYLKHEVDLPDGTRQLYGPAGDLFETDTSDGGRTTVAADGTRSTYTSHGVLREVDDPTGERMTVAADDTKTFTESRGTVERVIMPDGSAKVAYVDGWLYFDGSGTYLRHEVDLPDGSRQLFGPVGRLYEIDAPSGGRTVIASDGTKSVYTAEGVLQEIDDPAGGRISLTPDGTETFTDNRGVVSRVVMADGSAKDAFSDGWLYFDAAGTYLKHEVVLPGGGRQLYGPAGALYETDTPDGAKTAINPADLLPGFASMTAAMMVATEGVDFMVPPVPDVQMNPLSLGDLLQQSIVLQPITPKNWEYITTPGIAEVNGPSPSAGYYPTDHAVPTVTQYPLPQMGPAFIN